MDRTLVERQTIRMYEREEESWRPLNRRRVAAFVQLFLLCLVYTDNGHRRGRSHPVTAKLLKKSLAKRILPFISRRLVWTMDEEQWPLTMEEFQELDPYLAGHLPRVHAGQHWQDISYFFKEVKRERDTWKRLDELEREAMEAVRRALER